MTIQVGDAGQDKPVRRLIVIQPLADRSKNTAQERMMLLDADVREAMALAARRLDQEATKYRVRGFEWDLNTIQYSVPEPRTVLATMQIRRPA